VHFGRRGGFGGHRRGQGKLAGVMAGGLFYAPLSPEIRPSGVKF
jgi:hypothetical protein